MRFYIRQTWQGYQVCVHLGTWEPMRYAPIGPVFKNSQECKAYCLRVKP